MNNNEKMINKYTKKQISTVNTTKKPTKTVLYAFICILFAFILYSNTITHSYVLDDHDNFTNNWVIKKGMQGIPILLKTTYRFGANNLSDNLYRPLSQIMFAIEWELEPNNPHFNHLINVLFYVFSSVLLLIVLRKYMSKTHSLIPLIITLMYVSHPIHTEVVANIKGRDEIMSFFFLMITLLLLHNWFNTRNWWSLIISLLTYFLAFMSKEGVLTMLFLFPLIGWYFTEAKYKTILISSVLLVIPAIAYITIRHFILLKYNMPFNPSIIDNFLISAPNFITHFSTAVMLLGKYLLLSLMPYQLVSDYSYNQIPIIGLSDTKFIISILIYIAICVYVVLNFRKKSPIVFGLLFFLITISMYSNILFQIGTAFGERLMFMPSLGVCIAFVCFVFKLLKINKINNTQSDISIIKSRRILTTICIFILIVFSTKTVVRAAEWKDQFTLDKKDIKRSPDSVRMCIRYGNLLFDKAEKEDDSLIRAATLSQAVAYFEKGLAIYPAEHKFYSQLSLAYLDLRNVERAAYYKNIALTKDSLDAITFCNIGLYYCKLNDYQKAIEVFNYAVKLDTDYVEAFYNRGIAKKNLKDYWGAIADYNTVLTINPKYTEAYNNRGVARGNIQDYQGAINDFTKALDIYPKNASAYFNKGCIFGKLKMYEEAIVEFKKCIDYDQSNINAYNNIGISYQNLKQPEEAKLWFEKVSILQQKNNK